MELNRENIIKALELCLANDIFDSSCEKCPYRVMTNACMDCMIKDALSLIKGLTEENKAWQKELISQKEKADKVYYELACEVEDLRAENERLKNRVLAENHLRNQAEEILANGMSVVKANTVRKMQELIFDRLDISVEGYSAKEVKSDVRDMVYQIAKEMIGEDNG